MLLAGVASSQPWPSSSTASGATARSSSSNVIPACTLASRPGGVTLAPKNSLPARSAAGFLSPQPSTNDIATNSTTYRRTLVIAGVFHGDVRCSGWMTTLARVGIGLLAGAAVVAAGACGRKPSYGAAPHLLGKLDGLDLTRDKAAVAAISSDLAAGSDVDDGALTYRVWFDKTGRIETVIEFVTGPLDDVFAAWGSGASGWFADHQGHFYYDTATRTRLVVFQDDPEKKHFTVEARPYVPFATLLGSGHDVQLGGVDVLGQPGDVAARALAGKGVRVDRFDAPTLSEAVQAWYSPDLLTDLGTCKLSLFDLKAQGTLSSYKLECSAREIDGGDQQMLARFEQKWGKPTASEHGSRYPGDKPRIVLREKRKGELELDVKDLAREADDD